MESDGDRIIRWYRAIPWAFLEHGLPLALIAYFFEVKWVVAYGFFALLFAVTAMDARLYDITVRLNNLRQQLRQDSN